MEKRKAGDYYLILGVDRDATPATIRRAYKRLAKKYQPESKAAEPTVEAFREVQIAYETLVDAERRRRYDETLREQEKLGDPLGWSLLRSPVLGELRRPVQPGTLSGEIVLTAHEAAIGGVLPLDIPLESSCPSCDGTGGPLFDCDRCGGEGAIERRFPVPIRIPPHVKEGTVFQVSVDDPGVLSILLTVHIRPF